MDNIFIKQNDIIIFDDKHKLFCGDSTKIESYDFMENEIATMCFTSPPYNVGGNNYNYEKTKKYQNKEDDLKNDNDYFSLIDKSLKNAIKNSEYVFYNIQHLSGNKRVLFEWLNNNKNNFVDTIIWRKTTTNPTIEPNILNSDFEYIYIYNNKENPTKHINIGKRFCGNISNVLECKRNTRNEYAKIHSALMPIELCDKIINTFTLEDDIVLDCFSGLGTNLISCKLNNRIYRGIELSPLYCQETIKRYLEYDMGNRNIKIIRDGKIIEFDEFKEYILGNQISIFDI